ncbi:hypothetical protein SAMN05421788_109180 [Filimonas lacunae]|uniref:Uncharacterized protein n=1 Tax=Filimonas lacunae TaxID=477680 RepID=A0A173MJ15_9BACT|nr:hypothetical protein [Filimonas lacunae]BAV07467.1 hypothetical protein FLA_3492 [Filimonas lacunae]SIT30269.1 hypothetical protein SAMN05421788_109180 [Filimonas lacunae]
MKQQSTGFASWLLLMLLLPLLGFVFSCKKTENIPYDRLSNNTIQEYKVTNIPDTVYGAIDNIKNTITLYIPYYVGIDYIVPAITIDKTSQLLDASGKVINLDGGIAPVPVDTTGYTYTVRSSDSVKRTYTLVIEIAPSAENLKAGFGLVSGTSTIDTATAVQRNINGRMAIYGNFGSTSTNVKFTFTNQATGKEYTNIFKPYNVTPGANYYTMLVDIDANADSGYYKVTMKHQGRTTQLPGIHLVYNKPLFANVKSLSAYAAGDTLTFTANGLSTTDKSNGVITGLKRAYMMFWKSGFTYSGVYPATFPDSLWGQKLEMKIISWNRTQVKVVFPEIPAGAVGSYQWAVKLDKPGIGFYFDFDDSTGWGIDNPLSNTGLYFTVKPKQ